MKKAPALLFGFLLLLLAGRVRAAGPPTLVLRDTTTTYLLESPYLQVLRVDTALTLAQIVAPRWAARFAAAPAGTPNYGGDPADFWLRAQVRSQARASTVWVLDTRFGSIDFEVYVTDSLGQPLAHTVVDAARRIRNGQAVPGRHPSVRLALPAGQPAWVYVHATGAVFKFRVRELTNELQLTRVADLYEALYFGILLALMLYNLGLFFSVRDRAYLYYVGFVASFGALQASLMNYLAVFVWPTASPEFDNRVNHLLLVALMVLGIHTARAFMELATYTPRLDRLLRALAWTTLLLPLFDLLAYAGLPAGYWLSNWAEVVMPLTGSAVTLLAGALTVRAGYGPARYYLAGWAILLAATTSYYLRILHVLPPSLFTEYSTRIASVLDLLLISLGLADRINIARQERREALDHALAVAQEKEAVQSAANRSLALRADELQVAYADLQASLRTTESLTERDELKTRFFTNISHELRTPLTLILGPLEQLLETPAAVPVAPELHLMHRHGARLLALINQLLDVARLEAGQMALHAAPHDLHGFVRLQVAAFQSQAAYLDLTLDLPPVAPPLEVYFDADQLEKVFTNLLGNALKFTPGGGRVDVRVSTADGPAPAAVITVADTGCGIPAAHLPLIFDRFHQVDDSTRRAHEGSGIGLALVKELVSLHGGTVAVESVAGQGTTFSVRLQLGTAHLQPEQLRPPAAPTVAEPVAAVRLPAPMPDSSTGELPEEAPADTRPLVLIIDDHADMRAYLSSCLGEGYRIISAPDGRAGLARATELLPDLVLSDLMMPHLDGLELCRRLKTDERTSHIPVVLLTARAAPDSRVQGLETGADDYLTKPFRPAELRVRVANLLAQRQLLRQRFAREVTLRPRDISITSADEVFLTRALAVVEKHFADPAFDVETFAAALAMSRVHLFRKLKALTDQAPTDFVRVLRLRRAAQLLAGGAANVSEVAYAVGFNNLSHFSKSFRELHGHAPSEHATSVVEG